MSASSSADEAEQTAHLLVSTRTSDKSVLSRLLSWDVRQSARFYSWYGSSPCLPHWLLLFLEASGHGLIWMLWPPVLFILMPDMSAKALSGLCNFYVLVLLDLLVIVVLKPMFHRQRPPYNSGLQAATVEAVDQFSFPSGHATRAASVAAFVVYASFAHKGCMPRWMESSLFLMSAVAWGMAVTASRVALGRHHVLDVVFGALVGIAYLCIIDPFWVSEEQVSAGRDYVISRVPQCVLAGSEKCGLQ